MRILAIAIVLGTLACDEETLDLTPRRDAASPADAATLPDRLVPDAVPPGCDVEWPEGEPVGWPFDLERWGADVAPLLVERCAECHASGRPFEVRATSVTETCDGLWTLRSFRDFVDLATPVNSQVYRFSSGSDGVDHPLVLEDPELLVLLAFVDDAGRRAADGPPPDAAPVEVVEDAGVGPGEPVAFARFVADVQNPGDAHECGSCHHEGQVAGGFRWFRRTRDPEKLRANYDAVVERVDVDDPEGSVYVRFATSVHSANRPLNEEATAQLLAWIRGE